MNSWETIYDSILAFGTDIFFNFFIYGFIGSLIGLIGTIYLVRRMKRAGMLDRPNRFWNWLVGLNRIYLPVVAMIFMGITIGVYGVNSTINSYVENTIHSAIDELSLDHINLEQLQNHIAGQMTLQEALTQELGKSNDNYHINSIISSSILNEFGYPTQIDDFITEIRSIDWTVLNKGMHYGVTYIATDYVDGIFWFAYRIVVVFFFLTFLKIPLLEALFYFIFKRVFLGSRNNSSDIVEPISLHLN